LAQEGANVIADILPKIDSKEGRRHYIAGHCKFMPFVINKIENPCGSLYKKACCGILCVKTFLWCTVRMAISKPLKETTERLGYFAKCFGERSF